MFALCMAIMWADGKIDLRVYFTDMKALITKAAVCGNVIDAYTEVLLTKQMAIAANQETPETSYFFSSISLGMFGNNNESSYTWKHYNPLRPCNGIEDAHFKKAQFVKNCVLAAVRQRINAHGSDDVTLTEDFEQQLEESLDCPRQKAGSLDCAVIVCAIMRQYVHHVEVRRSLQEENCIVLRATMVKDFVNDLVRGLLDDV
ncbi:hypothetical protein LOK49_LG02G02224 [Camellia lanceoleosa]|uniref:Uncharacterized protein n=1 Tax=Camellia lanceoleosa TaxID=1840588 RepID=A0ACC0IPI0_9ERIC|nr:hypothetical protein LOK49_LG02G02224 [Camellia lanceoleosa]